MNVLNKDDDILIKLKEIINDSDEIYISVSFITWSGIKLLFKDLNLPKKIKVITTTEEFITDYKSLDYFYKNKHEVKLIDKYRGERSFHSKFIIIRKNNEYFSMVGSLNFTENSFKRKFESVIFNYDSKKLLDDFNFLWDKGELLTKEFLLKYKENYKNYSNEFVNFKKDLIKRVNLSPNEMQNSILEELNEVRSKGENTALLYAATGTGKTYLSAFDVKYNGFKKLLFIVHNRTIIKSAKRDFDSIFYDKKSFELFSYNHMFVEENDLIFTTQNTINKLLKEDENFLKQFDYVIFDEAHKVGEKNIQGLILRIVKEQKETFILGMTATPNRSDDPLYVINQFKNIVGNINLEEAIKRKWISTFKYYGVDVDVDFEVDELREKEVSLMVEKFVNELSKRRIWNNKKIKGIIFTKNINEANIVSELLNKYNYKSTPLHSKSDGLCSLSIGNYIESLQNEKKDLNFIVTVDMFNEGVDIPSINTIGMFRFTNSSIIYTQQIGRGLRREGSDNKYLNIIDLVGNSENSFERIIGLSGKETLNPMEIIRRLSIDDLNNNDFQLSEISRNKILNNLNKMSYLRYFKDKIFTETRMNKKDFNLLNMEEILGESIQIISNNFRKRKTMNLGDKSWLRIAYETSGKKFGDINKIENQIIELFSWMPFTVSTTEEKEKIIDLLSGKTVSLSNKWINYFIGNKDNNKWFRVLGDFSDYFSINKNNIYFNMSKIKNKGTNELLKEILNYLIINKNRNDKLIRTWYSKAEILFMAGHYRRKQNFNGKILDSDETLNDNDVLLANSIGNSKYENKVINKNTFILSRNSKKELNMKNRYHNFIGKKLFYKHELFYYVGEPVKQIEKYDIYNDEYIRYKYESKYSLSMEMVKYFQI